MSSGSEAASVSGGSPPVSGSAVITLAPSHFEHTPSEVALAALHRVAQQNSLEVQVGGVPHVLDEVNDLVQSALAPFEKLLRWSEGADWFREHRDCIAVPGVHCVQLRDRGRLAGIMCSRSVEQWHGAVHATLLLQLHVRSRWQRKGIGTALYRLAQSMACSAGHDALGLVCLKSNVEARAFYDAVGADCIAPGGEGKRWSCSEERFQRLTRRAHDCMSRFPRLRVGFSPALAAALFTLQKAVSKADVVRMAQGVFADEDIEDGEPILMLDAGVSPDLVYAKSEWKEMRRTGKLTQQMVDYSVKGKSGIVFNMCKAICGKVNTARRLWLGDAPAVVNATLNANGSLLLKAQAHIRKGEEIFWNYNRKNL